MIKKTLLQAAPIRRLRAADGMTVTAEVWEDAHNHHRQQQQLHARWGHGVGIVAGLEVKANDPADSAVYIFPGLAADAQGQTIVISEPLSFDLGERTEGLVYVLLTYGEGRPRPKDGRAEEGGALYIQSEYGIEAATTLPAEPYIELARVRRERGAALKDPRNPTQPGVNEIDGRFRLEIGVRDNPVVTIGVCVLDGKADSPHIGGAARLAQALRGPVGNSARVWVDAPVALTTPWAPYTLIYLVAHGPFTLSPDQMTVIYNYRQQGGTVLFEACRQNTAQASAAQKAFADMLESFGLALKPAEADVLPEPHFFPAWPAGFETEAAPAPLTAPGVLVCSADYGCLWNGAKRGRPATREDMRAAYEWGHNVVAYAHARRVQAQNAA